MHYGLHAGFGGLLGTELLAALKGFGYTLLRVEQGLTLDDTRSIAHEVIAAGMTPLVVLFQPEHVAALPPGCLAEADNEPDLAYPNRTIAPRGVMPHADYIDFTHRIAEQAPPDVQLLAGAVSNPNRRGVSYMRAVSPHLQARYWHSWHRYPTGGAKADWWTPHDGFRDRYDEVALMRAVAHGRPIAITEGGYHTAPRKGRWWQRSARWSQDDVARLWQCEWSFWNRMGVECAVRYQLNSGPNPDAALDTYGIRDVNGLFLPSAPVLALA